MPLAMERPARASMRESAIERRSFTPSADRSPDRSVSRTAAWTRSATAPRLVQPPSISRVAAARLPARSNFRTAVRAFRLAPSSLSPLASQTVQVTSDAKANPIITAFTMMSTFMNIDHDDRSRGRAPGRSHCSWLGCCRCGGLGVDEVRGLARRCPRRVLCRGGMRRGNGGGRVRRGRRDRWRPALGQRRGLWRQYGANQTGPTSSRGSNTQRHGIWPSVTHLAVHLVIPTPQNACAFAPMALRETIVVKDGGEAIIRATPRIISARSGASRNMCDFPHISARSIVRSTKRPWREQNDVRRSRQPSA
jgi:hypothetical protein